MADKKKRRRKRKRRLRVGRLILMLVILVAVIAGVMWAITNFSGDSEEAGPKQETAAGQAANEAAEAEKEAGVQFPYVMEDGKITVNSLFQSSMNNPDCGDTIGEDVAGLEITNTSDRYCASLNIVMTMTDGRQIPFRITDVPAGKTVWAFGVGNEKVSLEEPIAQFESDAEFTEPCMLEDKIRVDVNDTAVTLSNLTGAEVRNLTVYCHCIMDDVYFGGITYAYKVEQIPANESVQIVADECYMGFAEVVRIEQQ